MRKTFSTLLHILAWLVFSPLFILLIARNGDLSRKTKKNWYLAALLSPFALFVFLFYLAVIFSHRPSRFSMYKLQKSVGVTIPWLYSVEKNTIEYSRQDYIATVELRFSGRGMKKLMKQIEKSGFYNFRHNLSAKEAKLRLASDTAFFNDIVRYLEKERLTGIWVKTDSVTCRFIEPELGDIPNSAILFHQGYVIEAVIRVNEKRLCYKYLKI